MFLYLHQYKTLYYISTGAGTLAHRHNWWICLHLEYYPGFNSDLSKQLRIVIISSMETAFSAYSNGITTLEHEVTTLKSKLDSITQVNEILQLTVKDMGSHSQQQNLRVLDIPEGLEWDAWRHSSKKSSVGFQPRIGPGAPQHGPETTPRIPAVYHPLPQIQERESIAVGLEDGHFQQS